MVIASCLVLLASTVSPASSQELEPRNLTNLPVGTNFAGAHLWVLAGNCLIPGSGACELPLSFVAHLEGFERGFEPKSRGLGTEATAPVLDATLDFMLRPTRPINVTVHGQVTDGTTGDPIEGATISVHDFPWGFFFNIRVDSTSTDSAGMYEIVTADLCAMSGPSCFVSLAVWAQTSDQLLVARAN